MIRLTLLNGGIMGDTPKERFGIKRDRLFNDGTMVSPIYVVMES